MLPKDKQTPIRKIPEGWGVVRLGDVAKIRGNKAVNNIDRVAVIPMELVPDNGIFTSYKILPKNEVKSSTYCEAGDVLLAKITPSLENGKQGIVPLDIPNGFAMATTEVFPIVPDKDKLDRLFLFYILKANRFRQKIIASMTGTTGRQRATKKAVVNLQIPLPPLPEQRRIARVLSTVDAAIERTDAMIAHADRLKKGLMQRLLTQGIGHEEFGDTEIGRIPAEWEVVRLGDVAGMFQYGISSKLYDYGKYPVIKMDSIVNGKIMPVNLKYTNLEEETFEKYRLEKGDVLINRTNSYELVGRTGVFMLDGDYVFASYLIRIRPNQEKIDSEFLAFYLNFNVDRLRQLATRAVSQANINATNLKNFKLPLPPLEEQKKIAEILGTVDRKLELLRARRERLERVKKGLMNDLLTGRKRVPEGVV